MNPRSSCGVMAWRRRLIGVPALLAILVTAGCGTASPGPGDEVSTSSTTVPNTLITSSPPTTLPSTTRPLEPVTTVVTSSERLPALSLEEVAYAEVTNPNADVTGPGDRLLLSAVGDVTEVQPLVDAYTKGFIPANVSLSGFLYRTLVFHLVDGRALTVRWDPAAAETCSVDLYDGQVLNDDTGDALYGPVWSDTVVAPRLLERAQLALDQPRDGAGTTSLPPTMPDDFGFIAGFSVYGKDVLDTFAGTLQKDMGLPPGTTAHTSLSLTPAQLEEVYAELVALDILGYPTDYAPKAELWASTSEFYYLRFRVEGVEKEIRWEEGTLSDEPRAVVLRAWFDKLRDLIYQTPEYKDLPPLRGGYV
ncbi:MAG: hypothetical protein JXA87_06760 [Thermoleophilia bacterium]|nr:hypothetical protein [Thermoleophilia bacterium]